MAINDGDVLRASVNISLPDNVIAQNVFYWRLYDPTPNNPSDSQIKTALGLQLVDIYSTVEASIVDDVTILDADIDVIEWAEDHWENVENLGIYTLAIAGDDTGNMAPHGVSAVVTANTIRPQTRGRKFIPGIGEEFFDESDATATLTTRLTNFLTQWMADQSVTGASYLVPVVVGMVGASAGGWYDLISGVVNTIAGYQRRRKPGVGS